MMPTTTIDNDYTHHHDDTLSCIQAMRGQEDEVSTCINYLQFSYNNSVNVSSRTAMVTWCQQLQKKLKLSPETASFAISFFDRYLSSGKGKSRQALQDKYLFQLSAIVSFYISVKLYETTELTVDTLVKICKGCYAKPDIIETEEEILFALDYRLATPLPIHFVKEYIKMLPPEVDTNVILDECKERIGDTEMDMYYTFCKASVVGLSCLLNVLVKKNLLSSTQRQVFYLQLSKTVDIIGVMEVQKRGVQGTKQEVDVSKQVSEKSNIESKAKLTAITIRQMLDDQKKEIRSMLEDQTNDIKQMLDKQTITKEAEEKIKAKEDMKQIVAEYSEAKDEHGCYARCA